MDSPFGLSVLNLPDAFLDQVLWNLPHEDLITCKLVCRAFNRSVHRVLASITVLEDTCESLELIFTLLPDLKNLHVIRHTAFGNGDEADNVLELYLLCTFCRKITYFQYAPVAFVAAYINQLEEKKCPVFLSKIKVANAYDLNSRDLTSLLERYPWVEIFVDELDLQSILDESWSDDDHLILHRITGLNPGMLRLNSSATVVTRLLSSVCNLRSLWIKLSIEDVHLVSSHCSRLKYLYIEDVESTESSDFCQIESLIKDKVPRYTSFSLCISSPVSVEKVKQLLYLLCEAKAKFQHFAETEWLSCDLCLGDTLHVWTREKIVYVESWPLEESLTSMLTLFLPAKRIQVKQQVRFQLVKDKWTREIETFAREEKVALPAISFTSIE